MVVYTKQMSKRTGKSRSRKTHEQVSKLQEWTQKTFAAPTHKYKL